MLIIVSNLPFLDLPFYLDGFWVSVGAEHILKNHLIPVLPPAGWDYGHPLLFLEVLALAWYFFGQTALVSHLVICVFSFITVAYTYRIGSYVYGRQTAIIASLLLQCYPLFIAQSSFIYIDLPAAAFATVAAYYALREKPYHYLLAASAMALTKAPTIWLVPAVLLYVYWRHRDAPWRRENIVRLGIYSLPALVLIAWFWYHVQATGWLTHPGNLGWFKPPNDTHPGYILATYIPHMLLSHDGILRRTIKVSWLALGWPSLLGGLTALIAYNAGRVVWQMRGSVPLLVVGLQRRVKTSRPALLILGAPIALHLLFVAATTYQHRYLLPIYPLYFLLAARALERVLVRTQWIVLAAGAILCVFVLGWWQPWFEDSVSSPSNLTYVNFIRTHEQALAVIETQCARCTVLAAWPQYLELASPVQGYVQQPYSVLAERTDDQRAHLIHSIHGRDFDDWGALTPSDFDLVYYANRGFRKAELLQLVNKYQLPLIAEFGAKDAYEYVAIYGRFQPSSAQHSPAPSP